LIVFPGRVEKRKGVEILVKALSQVQAEGGEFRAVFLGNAWGAPCLGESYGDQIRHQAEEYQLTEKITWTGHLDQGRVQEYVKQAAVVVIPSLWENLPYTAMEAMAWGKIIIASAVGGLPEMIEDGVSGLLVPPGDSRALAGKIRAVIQNPGQFRHLGEAARKRVAERYLPPVLLPVITRFYQGEKDA
jgi:glycosyltransferase involved in cell wall biosynthesis